jgi:hypothetical protein
MTDRGAGKAQRWVIFRIEVIKADDYGALLEEAAWKRTPVSATY